MVNASCLFDSLRLGCRSVWSRYDTVGFISTLFSAGRGINWDGCRELRRNLVWVLPDATVQCDRFYSGVLTFFA